MGLDPDTSITRPGEIAAESAALLLPPVAFLTNLAVAYGLVDPVCLGGSRLMLLLAHGVCLLAALAGGVVAARVLHRAVTLPPAPSRSRSCFIGRAALLSSGLFTLVILAQWIPELFVDPCR